MYANDSLRMFYVALIQTTDQWEACEKYLFLYTRLFIIAGF